MGELLIWNDDWLLGIAHLDQDHQEIVRLINRLKSIEETQDTPLQQRVDELVALLRKHFQAEEAFLLKIGYPAYNTHKREHSLELAEFMALERELEGSHQNVLEHAIFQQIKCWFLNHAVVEDRDYAEYYFKSMSLR